MIQPIDIYSMFMQLSEIALVFSGFVAVFLGVSGSYEMREIEAFFMKIVLVEGVLSAMAAMFPAALLSMGLSGDQLWFWAFWLATPTALLGDFLLSRILFVRIGLRQFRGADAVALFSAWLIGHCGMVLHGVALVLGPDESRSGYLFVSLILYLGCGATAFVYLLFVRLDEKTG